jgi:hypothetical protein
VTARGCGTIGCAVAALVAAGLAVAGYLYFTGPVLVFTNRLVAPVQLVVEGVEPRTLAPGETVSLRLDRRELLAIEWRIERPLSPDGRPLGQAVTASMVVREPRGRIRRAAQARGAHGDWFAPLVTNETGEPLRIVVNAGLEGAMDCGCAVRAGARRAFVGYYPLFRNSTVQARGSGGRRATFRDLGPEVRDPGGTVGLRFAAGDLRAP